MINNKLKIRIYFTGAVLSLLLVSGNGFVSAQQSPLSTMSYWVFTPYLYNPAIVGSKDFFTAGLNASFQGNSNTQVISGSSRISKTNSGYFASPDIKEFRNIGIGANVFRESYGRYSNTGGGISGSYQIPLTTKNLSFLSVGAGIKGVSGTVHGFDGSAVPTKRFYPDLDLGIYYFGTYFFAGISTINILDNPKDRDSQELISTAAGRKFFTTAGFKILLDKSMNIVLEPSVLMFSGDSANRKMTDNITPLIKLYLDTFCFGTSFNGKGKISLFAQFKYPKFYVGAYYEMKKNTAFYKNSPLVEFTLGFNLQSDQSRLSNHSHW